MPNAWEFHTSNDDGAVFSYRVRLLQQLGTGFVDRAFHVKQQMVLDFLRPHGTETRMAKLMLSLVASGLVALETHEILGFVDLHKHLGLKSLESVDSLSATTTIPPFVKIAYTRGLVVRHIIEGSSSDKIKSRQLARSRRCTVLRVLLPGELYRAARECSTVCC